MTTHLIGPASPNRSLPAVTVVPVLHYANVNEAARWLCQAFGFVERLRIGDHRIQLSVGDGAVVVASRPASATEMPTAHSVMVRVIDVDAHLAHALEQGARVIAEANTYPYGERQYTAVDIGGHVWTFSQTVVDADPASWGGVLLASESGAASDNSINERN
ncbi:VOC family protein [Tahibacter amnicola]|uniref:Glyoxalase n=1 Tax=Tahibacter amnicola TaxID=2976241 RepID=A0ABY6BAK6_9GAMM|nr:VOC family protein [Tahibacter amnicola]UXI66562.1 glyoxalase [Tahibacter amnicola]